MAPPLPRGRGGDGRGEPYTVKTGRGGDAPSPQAASPRGDINHGPLCRRQCEEVCKGGYYALDGWFDGLHVRHHNRPSPPV